MSATLERRPELMRTVVPPTSSRAPRVRFLLSCGVAYGVVYVVANDVVAATLHDGFEAGAEGERGLAGASPSAERDDADLVVEQQVEGDALLGGPPV